MEQNQKLPKYIAFTSLLVELIDNEKKINFTNLSEQAGLKTMSNGDKSLRRIMVDNNMININKDGIAQFDNGHLAKCSTIEEFIVGFSKKLKSLVNAYNKAYATKQYKKNMAEKLNFLDDKDTRKQKWAKVCEEFDTKFRTQITQATRNLILDFFYKKIF